MKLHELKILPNFYDKFKNGEKRFRIRKDDRRFKVGDLIRLNEFDNGYTGRNCLFEIIYISIEKDYCILSIKPYRTDTYLGLTR